MAFVILHSKEKVIKNGSKPVATKFNINIDPSRYKRIYSMRSKLRIYGMAKMPAMQIKRWHKNHRQKTALKHNKPQQTNFQDCQQSADLNYCRSLERQRGKECKLRESMQDSRANAWLPLIMNMQK